MATKLDKTIKREIEMDGQAYMVTISPDGVKLTQKGFRTLLNGSKVDSLASLKKNFLYGCSTHQWNRRC